MDNSIEELELEIEHYIQYLQYMNEKEEQRVDALLKEKYPITTEQEELVIDIDKEGGLRL